MSTKKLDLVNESFKHIKKSNIVMSDNSTENKDSQKSESTSQIEAIKDRYMEKLYKDIESGRGLGQIYNMFFSGIDKEVMDTAAKKKFEEMALTGAKILVTMQTAAQDKESTEDFKSAFRRKEGHLPQRIKTPETKD